jgi:hypothetical protein
VPFVVEDRMGGSQTGKMLGCSHGLSVAIGVMRKLHDQKCLFDVGNQHL